MGKVDLVNLSLDVLSCSQKELALRLGVSQAQITFWKQGKFMSQHMESKLRAFLGIGDRDPTCILWAGSIEAADQWDRLIHFIAQRVLHNAEAECNTDSRYNDGLLCGLTIRTLNNMGVEAPKCFPEEIERIFDNFQDANNGGPSANEEKLWGVLEGNPYSSLICNIYESLNDVYRFFSSYISQTIQDDMFQNTPAENIEPCLISLAATKVQVDLKFACRFAEFSSKVVNDYKGWLCFVKDTAFRNGISLNAELIDLVYGSHGELGCSASKKHPDVYMDEIMSHVRENNEMLTAIMKKLGIYEEFWKERLNF